MCGCLSHTLNYGLGPQPRHVPWLGIEPVTLWFTGWHSIHWATPARAIILFSIDHLYITSQNSTKFMLKTISPPNLSLLNLGLSWKLFCKQEKIPNLWMPKCHLFIQKPFFPIPHLTLGYVTTKVCLFFSTQEKYQCSQIQPYSVLNLPYPLEACC